MTDSSIQVPHLSLPLRLGMGGTFATVEQDSDDEIVQGVAVLIATPQGRQVELPEYGVPDEVFLEDTDMNAIIEAVELWQPRASVDPSVTIDSADELIRHVQVSVSTSG